ncbi:ATPase, AAA family protein, partial [Cardiosporidium cionae]
RLLPLLTGVVCTAGVTTKKRHRSKDFQRKRKDISSSSTVEWTQRATLCVLDEIDGATSNISTNKKNSFEEGKDVISSLVDLINKKDSKGYSVIKRPIICLCNDLWNRNLKILREKVKVISLPPPSENLLQQRMTDILNFEGFKSSSEFITKLIRLHNLDIRSSLHTLNFIA